MSSKTERMLENMNSFELRISRLEDIPSLSDILSDLKKESLILAKDVHSSSVAPLACKSNTWWPTESSNSTSFEGTEILNEKPLLSCSFPGCNSQFRKQAHLSSHELIHSDKRPFTCDFDGCDKAFRTTCHLKRHTATHSSEKPFHCDLCSHTATTCWNLKRHVRRTHCGLFNCPSCPKKFKKNKQLKEHISEHHSVGAPVCTFKGCGRVFPFHAKLREHMKSHSKSYTCSVDGCSLTFPRWSECRRHVAVCPKREIKCSTCEKVFSIRSNLREHEKIHLEEREVFQCTVEGCGRFYTKQWNLKIHMESYHENIRPFHCIMCNKSFHVKCLLLKHLKNHSEYDEVKQRAKHRKEEKRAKKLRIEATAASAVTGFHPALLKHLVQEDLDEQADELEDLRTDEYENATVECVADFEMTDTDESTLEEDMVEGDSRNQNELKEQDGDTALQGKSSVPDHACASNGGVNSENETVCERSEDSPDSNMIQQLIDKLFENND